MKTGSLWSLHGSSLAILVFSLARSAIAAPSPGVHGPDVSLQPVFSPDASRLAFASALPNLVTNDTNGRLLDVFVFEISSGRTELVSVRADGAGSGDGQSYAPQFAAGGAVVVFESRAENLVTNDANGRADVFMRDLGSGQTFLLSTNQTGMGANGNSFHPRASANGRRVVFQSQATDLTPTPDANGRDDLFLLDLDAATTTFLSTNRFRQPTSDGASEPLISGDGEFVVFRSPSTDLVQSPTSGYVTDLYVRRTDDGRVEMLRAITNGTRRTVPVLNPMIASATNQLACIFAPIGTFRFDLAASGALSHGTGSTTNLSSFHISNLAGPVVRRRLGDRGRRSDGNRTGRPAGTLYLASRFRGSRGTSQRQLASRRQEFPSQSSCCGQWQSHCRTSFLRSADGFQRGWHRRRRTVPGG